VPFVDLIQEDDASPQYAAPDTDCQPGLHSATIFPVHAGPNPSDADVGKRITSQKESIGLGPALRHGWIGYQVRLDEAMAAAGFGERRFPDGRALRLCSNPAGSTISAIGREIGITRQGAAKVVAQLSDRGYVSVANSASSGREKSVTVTALGIKYLEAQRSAAKSIEVELRSALGEAGFSALRTLLDTLGGQGEQIRMRDYFQR
jgi:DNA-binding MarR family transcriptional regulator